MSVTDILRPVPHRFTTQLSLLKEELQRKIQISLFWTFSRVGTFLRHIIALFAPLQSPAHTTTEAP